MLHTRLTVLAGAAEPPVLQPDEAVIHLRDLKSLVYSPWLLRHLFKYREVRLLAADVDLVPRPAAASVLLRLLSRGRCLFIDEQGRQRTAGVLAAISLGRAVLLRRLERPALRQRVIRQLEILEKAQRDTAVQFNPRGRVAYIYADLTLGIKTGGAVSHVAGVLNALARDGAPPVLLAPTVPPTLDPRIVLQRVRPGGPWDGFEPMALRLNQLLLAAAEPCITPESTSFVYQRNTVNTFAGLALARAIQRPLVIEFNGSEIWAQRHWGNPLRDEVLASRIERLMLTSADLIVAVSQTIRDQVVEMGIAPDRVLVNPNGVDPDRYHPSIDGSVIRVQYDLADATVIGFIGTFGAWHGAEILVQAYADMLARLPGLRVSTRLLMIGDGLRATPARQLAEKLGIVEQCVFAGQVPQGQGPKHLAACNILVAPHVPNPDGSAFFGSPTKLFEYMAMGKGIAASRLGQIADLLLDGRTALLTTPGDPHSLTDALVTLVTDKILRERLGDAARQVAVEHHTWQRHTQRIIDTLKERCACG